jgi:hypothetical protein
VDIVEGWRGGSCIEGQCRVRDCLFGYHLVADGGGLYHCELDTPEVCGEYKLDCTSIANATSADCVNGSCLVRKCLEGYYAYDDKCVVVDAKPCGENFCGLHEVCNIETRVCECEDGYTDCDGFCYDLTSNAYHCGACDNACRKAHADSMCVGSECAYSCSDGYAINEDNDMCVFTGKCAKPGYVYNENTNRCELAENVCTRGQTDCKGDASLCCDCAGACDGDVCDNSVCDPIVGCADNTECASACCLEYICVAKSQCVSCDTGYHVFENACEPDDVDNCGAHDNPCRVENAANCCEDAACGYTCDEGYSDNGLICCANVENGYIVDDDGESCRFDCDTGYCSNGVACVDMQTDMDNCGVCGLVCNTEQVLNSKNVICSVGVCSATDCADGYRLVNGTCMPNDCTDGQKFCSDEDGIGQLATCSGGVYGDAVSCGDVSCNGSANNCGECKNTSKTCNYRTPRLCSDGAWSDASECGTDEICDSGRCKKCDTGSHVNGNSCENDTLSNCGGKVCNVANAENACTDGVCTFTCNTNYHKTIAGTGCEQNSIEDCG